MKTLFLSGIYLALLYLVQFSLSMYTQTNDTIFKQYETFIIKYNKKYTNESEEFWNRFHVFKKSLVVSSSLNTVHVDQPVYGVTKFSDLTPEEFKRKYLEDLKSPLIFIKTRKTTPLGKIKKLNVPQKVDWRTEGIISDIKNQGSCGACWAFSAVETIESMYSKEVGVLVPDLAVQEVIDCSYSNEGCNGGDTCGALSWLQNGAPLVYESAYPLIDKTQVCSLLTRNEHSVNVFNHTCHHYVGHEDEMINLLANVGPITVTVDATTWNNYVGGVIQYHCSDFNNHAVQIVGYDLSGDVPYYIVRNSWGKDFGLDGYLYIKIGEDLCGIASRVSAVFVKK